MVSQGELYGAYLRNGRPALRQEGRLGYEQYAASGVAAWGLDPYQALKYGSVEKFSLLGVDLLRDTRNGAPLTSEPFLLARIEIGSLGSEFDALERAVYRVQQKYSEIKGIPVAVSEDAIDRSPWFLYHSISYERSLWAVVTPAGRRHANLASISVKTAMAWWVIYGDEYSSRVFDAVKAAFDPERGYYAGIFDGGGQNKSLNVNTNAIILEAILYQHLGRRSFLSVSAGAPPVREVVR